MGEETSGEQLKHDDLAGTAGHHEANFQGILALQGQTYFCRPDS
jgi:hypothetical protein